MTLRRLRSVLARPLVRSGLGRAAAGYAALGWPVLPGAWWDGDRFCCGGERCTPDGHHLAGQHGGQSPGGWTPGGVGGSMDPARVRAVWTEPYTVAVGTSVTVDVLEAPGAAAAVVADLPGNGLAGPVARLPTGRWLIVTAAAADLDPGLLARARAAGVLHGRGSYVPLPPSRLEHGRVVWAHRPVVARLPHPLPVLARLLPTTAVDVGPGAAGTVRADPRRGAR